MTEKRVVLPVFPGVELLDFCGPYEVLSACRLDESRRREEASPFVLQLAAESMTPVACANGPRFLPDVLFSACPPPDILIVPGGWGVRTQIDNAVLVDWIRTAASRASLVASVKGAFNAVRVEGDASGPILLHGKGAGDLPTGSAVLGDILSLARTGMIPNNTGFMTEPLPDARRLDPDDAVCPHYMHFTVQDQPGVMAAIAKSMGTHGVSIRQAVQKGEPEDGYVPIVFLTHEAPARAIKGVLTDTGAMAHAIMGKFSISSRLQRIRQFLYEPGFSPALPRPLFACMAWAIRIWPLRTRS